MLLLFVESPSPLLSPPPVSKGYVSPLLPRPSSSLSPICSLLRCASPLLPSLPLPLALVLHTPSRPISTPGALHILSMKPFQAPQVSTPAVSPQQEQDKDMSPGSNRKKPVCQRCGHPMVGHKRPYGAPICPDIPPIQVVSPRLSLEPTLPVAGPSTAVQPATTSRGIGSPGFAIKPSKSGYWHRANPNWIDPNILNKADHAFSSPQRGDSWVSTEPASSASHSSRRGGRPTPGLVRNNEVIHIDVEPPTQDRERSHFTGSEGEEGEEGEEDGSQQDEEGEDLSDTQSNASSASSNQTILKRMSRGLSVVGRSTPLAYLYSSHRDDLTTLTSAAEAEGLYTRVVHNANANANPFTHRRARGSVKSEPATPARTPPTRENSWWVAVGHDRHAVDALVASHTPRAPPIEIIDAASPSAGAAGGEGPYDFDRGLDPARNERVGTYPVDPRAIRSTFLDTLLAGAVGGLVMFYCLSAA